MSGRERAHLRALGARLLSEANDLKRTPEALCRELSLSPALVLDVLAGDADAAAARALADAMLERYPIAPADLAVAPDDTDEGVVLLCAADSRASSRVFERPDRSGAPGPYYEYRDTAMSRAAPFRPEWIRELRRVGDADPDNPDVAYNRGHGLHQLTFFAGPVNFYWELEGKRFCAELDTGDSNYITPFVPHSFTSRDPERPGLIVAVTYAGEVRRALSDFARMGSRDAEELAGDLRCAAGAFRSRLSRWLAAESLSPQELVGRLCDAGLAPARARALVAEGPAGAGELEALADALRVRPSDLDVCTLSPGEEVVVCRRDAVGRPYPGSGPPAYRLRELARTRHQPGLKGFELQVLGGGEGWLQHALHEYVFHSGGSPVELVWGDGRRALLEPGDSAVIQPRVAHRFAPAAPGAPGEPGRLVTIRVQGALSAAVLDEYAAFPPTGRSRVAGETQRWF